MGNDFTHALKLLQTFREAGLKPSTIESVIQSIQIVDAEKRAISILNHGEAKERMKFPNPSLADYFCYKTASEDCRKEFHPNTMAIYTANIGSFPITN